MIARPLLLATALLAHRAAAARADAATTSSPHPCCAPTSGVAAISCGSATSSTMPARAGADRDLPRAGSRHHRLAAGRAGAERAARASGDRRRHPRPQGNLGDAAGPHARGQGHRAAGRAARWSAATASATPPTSALTFDRDPGDVRLDAAITGGHAADDRALRCRATAASTSRFEIANENGAAPTKLRFTGTAVETVEAAVLARSVERNEILKSSDVVVERRPKAEVGADAAAPRPRGRHAGAPPAPRRPGAQGRRSRQARSGAARPERHADLRGAGLYLTMRGKALEGGTEGDVVNVLNLQSKRTVSGAVIGRGQVVDHGGAAAPPRPAMPPLRSSTAPAAPVAVANANSPVAPKAE